MTDPIPSELQAGRAQFLQLVDDVRPELHRYCARMTGSVADGEDVVQDTLARAYYDLSGLKELPALRPWLFRIAHNRALDFLRRYERRMREPLEVVMTLAGDEELEPENVALREDAVRLAVTRFLELAPAQRSCVILKDVLGHSLEEIAELLELSVPAVKAALHRGRTRLAELGADPEAAVTRTHSPALLRYAALFNARDFDGVRDMLVDEVKLDLVSRDQRKGRANVAVYFTNYSKLSDWHLVPGWLEGREVLAVFLSPEAEKPSYFVELRFVDEGVAEIRDFRYVKYICRDATIELG